MKKGKVYLVGAGPGREDLITLRGLRILEQADVVLYDYLANGTILLNAKRDAQKICCGKLAKKGKYSGTGCIEQEKINSIMIKKAREGKTVVRLKNGDPGVFSRSSQELERLVKEGVEFELVPGVTAANAASCFSGVPLTDRNIASSCIFVTGREGLDKKGTMINWDILAKADTMVFYMAVEVLKETVHNLIKAGRDKNTPVVIIENAGSPAQRILAGLLKNITRKACNAKVKPPAVIIIGKVADFGKRFNWLKRNKRILFTGLSSPRFYLNGTYEHIPLIKIVPIKNYDKFDRKLRNISDFEWIIFTSRYTVEYFFLRLLAIGHDVRNISSVKIAAIGNSTKNKLLDYGILADLVARKESSEGLIKEFLAKGRCGCGGTRIGINGKKIFIPRSNLSDKGLKKAFERLGAKVTTAIAYKNIMPDNLPRLDFNNFDQIIFTSPSTVRNFKKRYKKLPQHIKIKSIGSVTAREVRRCGI